MLEPGVSVCLLLFAWTKPLLESLPVQQFAAGLSYWVMGGESEHEWQELCHKMTPPPPCIFGGRQTRSLHHSGWSEAKRGRRRSVKRQVSEKREKHLLLKKGEREGESRTAKRMSGTLPACRSNMKNDVCSCSARRARMDPVLRPRHHITSPPPRTDVRTHVVVVDHLTGTRGLCNSFRLKTAQHLTVSPQINQNDTHHKRFMVCYHSVSLVPGRWTCQHVCSHLCSHVWSPADIVRWWTLHLLNIRVLTLS